MTTRLDGITPILSMPFTADGGIDTDGLVNQIDFLEGTGVRAAGFGYGSEITRLNEAEAISTLTAVCEVASGRLDIMATVGGGSIAAVIGNASASAGAGADLLMIRPAGGTPAQVTETLKVIASNTGLPLVLQDAPQMTMVNLSAAMMAEIVDDVPGMAALKIEAPNSAPKIGELARNLGDRVSVLGGAGGLDFANELARGANGTVPFVAFAPMFIEVQRLHDSGDIDGARDHFAKYVPFLVLSLRSMDTALWTFKELLRMMGVLNETHLRQPCETIDEDFKAELDHALADLERWGATW
jgi:dihydrodipicolinate synthase/N-acetylneuraminate lyase